MNKPTATDFLLQRDRLDDWLPRLGNEGWFVACDNFESDTESGGVYCALIPNSLVDKVLTRLSWDILKGDGLPGHTVQSDQDQEVVSYHRFGGDSGIEPLVFLRTFDGIKEPFLELSEEFRYFHNLYFDEDKQQFVKINSDGTEDPVGRIAPHRLDLRLREVRQFMAVRGMHLAVYFDIVRYSEMDAGQIDREAATKEIHEDLLRYRFHVSPCNFSSRREHHSFSRLLGKKLIPPLPLVFRSKQRIPNRRI